MDQVHWKQRAKTIDLTIYGGSCPQPFVRYRNIYDRKTIERESVCDTRRKRSDSERGWLNEADLIPAFYWEKWKEQMIKMNRQKDDNLFWSKKYNKINISI